MTDVCLFHTCAPPFEKSWLRACSSRHDGSCRKAPDDLIVANQCCVCLQGFNEDIEIGAGTNWVQCMCTRWLHEDCILDCVIDESGKEKLFYFFNIQLAI